MIEIESFDNKVTCIKTASPLGGQAIMWVYAYQVDDVIFDAGCWNAVEELRAFAQKHPVKRVFVTHNHEDHYGGTAAFLPVAEVFTGPVTLESLRKPYPLPEFFQFVWGLPEPVEEGQELTDASIVVGDYSFEVVDLSGHCEEMVGFWEPERRWFFSADAVPLPSQKQIAMPEENIPPVILKSKSTWVTKSISDLAAMATGCGSAGKCITIRDFELCPNTTNISRISPTRMVWESPFLLAFLYQNL